MAASSFNGLIAKAIWREARRRVRMGARRSIRFAGVTPDRVRLAPPDIRQADPARALDIYSGRFELGGVALDTGGASPFQIQAPSESWQRALHGFRWIRHLSAANTDLAAANGRALVWSWIRRHGRRLEGVAWEPETVAKRIIAWLQHSSILLAGADVRFYRVLLRSLAMQVRYLRAVAPTMLAGKERLRVRIALAFSALSLPASDHAVRRTSRHLERELRGQILPDGGHISRNPVVIIQLLADLLPLRQTYAERKATPPPSLNEKVERMLDLIGFFQLPDGSMARFNGSGRSRTRLVAAVMRHATRPAPAMPRAPQLGYDRLAQGETLALIDTGATPSAEVGALAHAGALSFELASGRHCVVVNCGVDNHANERLRTFARATAAHSTATINDASQGRFDYTSGLERLIGKPLLGGARHIDYQRIDNGEMLGLVANHRGYLSRFGLVHQRRLQLSENGALLVGRDQFWNPDGEAAAPYKADLRFHLHPDVAVAEAGHDGKMLTLPDGRRWRFVSLGQDAVIEESIFFAGEAGPCATRQIVVGLQASDARVVDWRFERLG